MSSGGKYQAFREGARFLISNASVLSGSVLAFVVFAAMTRMFSDSEEDRYVGRVTDETRNYQYVVLMVWARGAPEGTLLSH